LQTPAKSPFGNIAGAATRARKKKSQLEKRLDRLQTEIHALDRVVSDERVAVSAEKLQEAADKAHKLKARQRAGWEQAGKHLADFVRVWVAEVVEPAEEHDRLVGDVLHAGLTGAVQDTALLAEWTSASHQLVEPFPVDVAAAAWMLLQASTDLYGQGTRTLRQDGGLPVDDQQVLAQATPDLRGENRNAKLSGRVAIQASSKRFEQGYGPVW